MKDMPPNRDTMFENGGRPSTSDIMLGIIFVWKVPHGHMYNYRHYVQYSKNINLASRQHVGDYCMLVLRMRGYGSHLNHLIGKLAGTLAVGWSDIGFFVIFENGHDYAADQVYFLCLQFLIIGEFGQLLSGACAAKFSLSKNRRELKNSSLF